jgi:hypothetical protein
MIVSALSWACRASPTASRIAALEPSRFASSTVWTVERTASTPIKPDAKMNTSKEAMPSVTRLCSDSPLRGRLDSFDMSSLDLSALGAFGEIGRIA